MPKADFTDDELSVLSSRLKELSYRSLEIIEQALDSPDSLSPKDLILTAQDVLDRAGVTKQRPLGFDADGSLVFPVEAVAGALAFLGSAMQGEARERTQSERTLSNQASSNQAQMKQAEPIVAPKKKPSKNISLNTKLLERMEK